MKSFFMLLAFVGFAAASHGSTTVPQYHPSRLIVNLRDGAHSAVSHTTLTLNDLGIDEYRRFDALGNTVVYSVKDGTRLESNMAAIQKLPGVESVELDYRVSVSYKDGSGGYDLYGIDKVKAPCVWNKFTTGNAAVKVCVIDTGLDYNHPDLKGNTWVNKKELTGSRGKDDDGDGYKDDIYGWNAITNTGNVFDDEGHGTHVAGTIGALKNGKGVVGVSQKVQVLPCKFLDATGSGWVSDAITCINFCKNVFNRDRKAGTGQLTGIYSNSWGGGGYLQSLYNAIKAADTGVTRGLFLFAAGNDGVDIDSAPFYPASYNLPNIVSVAATDSADKLAYFSNYGKKSVDLAAPGVYITSTIPGNNYAAYSGTSMATPHVSGAAALLVSKKPAATTEQIKAALLSGVDRISSLNGKMVTGGRLNAFNSENKLLGTSLKC